MAYHCRQLKRKRLINKSYTLNGIVHIVRTEHEKPKKIFHITDLKLLYPHIDFGEDDESNDEEVNDGNENDEDLL